MLKFLRKVFLGSKKKETAGYKETTFSGKIARDEQVLRKTFEQCGDVTFRTLKLPALDCSVLIVFVGNLINKEVVNRDVIARLQSAPQDAHRRQDLQDLLGVGEIYPSRSVETASNQMLLGKTLVLKDGSQEALLIDTRQWPSRSVEEPNQEQVIQGAREGFTETINTNLALIRRRLPTPSLKIESMVIGRRTSNNTALLYMSDIAENNVVNEVRQRLKAIDIDGIHEPGSIGELIKDPGWPLFPPFLTTERPDKVAAALLQGKAAILADTSPFAYIIPATWPDFMQAPDDYAFQPLFGSIFRLIRFIAFFLALTFTSAYVAIVSLHYEMLPRDIIIFIAQARIGVPFPTLVEALLLEGAVELIRETSLRLPKPLSGTIGIVGGLVLGQAIVSARLVSPILLIIVAISFLAGFGLPNYSATLPIRYLRFPMLIAAGTL